MVETKEGKHVVTHQEMPPLILSLRRLDKVGKFPASQSWSL